MGVEVGMCVAINGGGLGIDPWGGATCWKGGTIGGILGNGSMGAWIWPRGMEGGGGGMEGGGGIIAPGMDMGIDGSMAEGGGIAGGVHS